MKKYPCMYIIQSKLFTLLPLKNRTNNNKHVICQLYSMQLQKKGILIQNSQAVKQFAAPRMLL